MSGASLTPSAELARDIPRVAEDRLDAIDTALASLSAEERRLLRLGFELPLARCHAQQKYWRFLRGLFATATSAGGPANGGRRIEWLGPSR